MLVIGSAAGAAERGAVRGAYPVRPVRLIVPYPPGGGNDTLARLFGQKLTQAWGVFQHQGAGPPQALVLTCRSGRK